MSTATIEAPTAVRRLNAAQQALAADPKHVAYARKQAEIYARRYPRLADEFEGAALLGLVIAASMYDFARNNGFLAYAGRRIVGAMIDLHRDFGPKGFKRDHATAPAIGSLDSMTYEASGGVVVGFIDEIGSEDEPIGWESEWHDELLNFGRKAGNTKTREMICLLYGHASTPTMAEVGKVLGVGEKRISQMHIMAIANLAEMYAGQREAG